MTKVSKAQAVGSIVMLFIAIVFAKYTFDSMAQTNKIYDEKREELKADMVQIIQESFKDCNSKAAATNECVELIDLAKKTCDEHKINSTACDQTNFVAYEQQKEAQQARIAQLKTNLVVAAQELVNNCGVVYNKLQLIDPTIDADHQIAYEQLKVEHDLCVEHIKEFRTVNTSDIVERVNLGVYDSLTA